MIPPIETAFQLILMVMALMWVNYYIGGLRAFWRGDVMVAIELMLIGTACLVITTLLFFAVFMEIPKA